MRKQMMGGPATAYNREDTKERDKYTPERVEEDAVWRRPGKKVRAREVLRRVAYSFLR